MIELALSCLIVVVGGALIGAFLADPERWWLLIRDAVIETFRFPVVAARWAITRGRCRAAPQPPETTQ